ncbi:MAG: extracellular solute-binding protein [Acidaminococcaceae bacterium]
MPKKISAALVLCGLLLIGTLGLLAKSFYPTNVGKDQVILKVYSVLPEDLTRALLDEYCKQTKTKLEYTILEKNTELKQLTAANAPDIYLATRETLIELAAEGKLQASTTAVTDLVPSTLCDQEGLWFGLCYNPYVLFINHAYSRKVGQISLQSWADVVKYEDVILSIEELGSSAEMKNFLTAFASTQGETETFRFLSALHKRVPQYSKFAISPIRLTTIGEADIAITSRNKVMKYIEGDFPAYILTPVEGTPVQLFAVGMSKSSKQRVAGLRLLDWLYTAEEPQAITEVLHYGYIFHLTDLTQGANGSNELWLNRNYLTAQAQATLVNKWLQTIRFADK